jgi:hypothetical protein
MAATVPYHAEDEHEYAAFPDETRRRDVVSAWIVATLLLLGGIVSFALDHLVTVSPDPVATYRETLRAAEDATADDGALEPDDEER